MRFLVLFTAAVSACAQTLPPLFDTQNAADWLSTTYLSQVQVDAAGDVYFAGTVPIANTVPATHTLGNAGLYDIVVLKMHSRLEQVRYVTVIGGGEALSGFQVDGEGHAFLAGRAASRDFPATKRLPGTAEDFAGFVLKLSA